MLHAATFRKSTRARKTLQVYYGHQRLQPGDYVRFHYDSNNLLLAWWHNKDEQPPIRIEPREHLCFFAGHQSIDEFHRSKVRIV